jgi:ribonucleoside-diphosphate reductase beta chain
MRNFTIYTKQDCPFCVNAKQLITGLRDTYTEVVVTQADELPRKEFRTVPQILLGSEFIGGFTQLLDWYKTAPSSKKKTSTVFNSENTGYLTGNYPLFLGEELGFVDTINQPYPQLETLYDTQMSFLWNHAEVDLTQDRQDMLNADPAITDLMVETILWQSMADSIASRAIGSILTKYISNSSLQDLYNAVILFETIHSKTYLHIIRQCFTNPNEVLQRGYKNLEIIKRSSVLIDSFNKLAEATNETDEATLRKLVLFCVVAMFLLESINFMASFAITFGIAERSLFQGISQDVTLICRDEMLHAKAGATVLGILKAQWPETFEELKPELTKLVQSVRDDEHVWADHAFSNGRQCPGINAQRIKNYVDYRTVYVTDVLGIPRISDITEDPLPYMQTYIDTSKVQSAAQEIQLTSYLVNSVKSVSEEEMNSFLEKMREEYL